MSPEERALRRAVYNAPYDDLPRLVLADWLEENGKEPEAHYIRLACLYAALEHACGQAARACLESTEINQEVRRGSGKLDPQVEARLLKKHPELKALKTAGDQFAALQQRIERGEFKPLLDSLGIFDPETTSGEEGALNPVRRIGDFNVLYDRGFPQSIDVLGGVQTYSEANPEGERIHPDKAAFMRVLQENPTIEYVNLSGTYEGDFRNLFTNNPFASQLKTLALDPNSCIEEAQARELLEARVGPFPNVHTLVTGEMGRLSAQALIDFVNSPRFPQLSNIIGASEYSYAPEDVARLNEALEVKRQRLANERPAIEPQRY